MEFNYNTGGREKYFKAEKVGDCVTRAIAIANNMDYKEVYDTINKMAKQERITKRKGISSARNGVYKETYRKLLEELGWNFHSTMGFGTGVTTHLKEEELPSKGTYILRLSKHLTTIIDGVINDTYNPDRGGTRAVYGWWYKED